jgi:drug/metabolite transporter superfamily protein YnfA
MWTRREGWWAMSKKTHRWLYPVIYIGFILISMLPLYTEKPYLPQDTQKVLISLFTIVTLPYQKAAIIFHILTLSIIILIILKPKIMGRVVSAYMGINYLVLSIVQTRGVTEEYGMVIHISGMVLYSVLGIVWIIVAFRNNLEIDTKSFRLSNLCLAPLVLLAFWAPYSINGNAIQPNFNPMLLLVSPDYGLTYCFTTPVFLFLLILVYPKVNLFAYRATAFNGLIYGILNLTHWINAESRWMGFLHLPLLVLSIYALVLPMIEKKRSNKSLELTGVRPT